MSGEERMDQGDKNLRKWMSIVCLVFLEKEEEAKRYVDMFLLLYDVTLSQTTALAPGSSLRPSGGWARNKPVTATPPPDQPKSDKQGSSKGPLR